MEVVETARPAQARAEAAETVQVRVVAEVVRQMDPTEDEVAVWALLAAGQARVVPAEEVE